MYVKLIAENDNILFVSKLLFMTLLYNFRTTEISRKYVPTDVATTHL